MARIVRVITWPFTACARRGARAQGRARDLDRALRRDRGRARQARSPGDPAAHAPTRSTSWSSAISISPHARHQARRWSTRPASRGRRSPVGDDARRRLRPSARQEPRSSTARAPRRRRASAISSRHRPAPDRGEREELLAFIAPTLAMALQNALSFQALDDYRSEPREAGRRAHRRAARRRAISCAGTVDQLREAQGARERFFGNISHEIRTPLSLILLAAADIEARAGALLDERARGSLGSITDARAQAGPARRRAAAARRRPGGQAAAAARADRSRPRWSITLVVGVAARRRGRRARARSSACRASLVAMSIRSRSSASRRTSSRTRSSTRRAAAASTSSSPSEPGGLRLSVLDTGPGIDDDLAGRLFGRFERASGEDRRKAGTGIGLLARQAARRGARRHGRARSPRATGGTELRVVLPPAIGDPRRRRAPAAPMRARRACRGRGPRRSPRDAASRPPGSRRHDPARRGRRRARRDDRARARPTSTP